MVKVGQGPATEITHLGINQPPVFPVLTPTVTNCSVSTGPSFPSESVRTLFSASPQGAPKIWSGDVNIVQRDSGISCALTEVS